VVDSAEWREMIPNRDPWLWIDDVVEMTDSTINAQKFLAPELPIFKGHYPDFPLLPGVVLCEACLEASAILIANLGVSIDGRIPVATGMNNVRFRKMVRPGDRLDIEVKLSDRVQDAFFLRGTVRVDGRVCASLDFVTTAVPSPVSEE